MAYGRTVIGTAGSSIQVSADGNPLQKMGGVTIDWSTVTAAGSDTTWRDGQTLLAGKKGLRYGQVICEITSGGSSGKYGPYDPAATDGRQTLTRGQAYILNRSAFQDDAKDEYPEAIYGGQVWLARIIQVGGGSATLAAGPTLANLLTVFPSLHPVYAGQ